MSEPIDPVAIAIDELVEINDINDHVSMRAILTRLADAEYRRGRQEERELWLATMKPSSDPLMSAGYRLGWNAAMRWLRANVIGFEPAPKPAPDKVTLTEKIPPDGLVVPKHGWSAPKSAPCATVSQQPMPKGIPPALQNELSNFNNMRQFERGSPEDKEGWPSG